MSQKPLGRNRLATQLKVGDGAVRTIISRLRKADLIDTSKEGCNLTEKGLETWRQFEQVFPKRLEVPKTDLSTAEFNYAFLVRNSGDKVKSGIDQRDAAIIAGAKKALVLAYKEGHLQIHSVSECIEKDYPKAAQQILELMTPQDNDVIVIAGADSTLRAKRGAFAASWSLISA